MLVCIRALACSVTWEIFSFPAGEPKYTDDVGCQKLGLLRVELPPSTKRWCVSAIALRADPQALNACSGSLCRCDRKFSFAMRFGGSEIQCTGVDDETGQQSKVSPAQHSHESR